MEPSESSEKLEQFRQNATRWAAGGSAAEAAGVTAAALASSCGLQTVVFVEGASDQAAVETAAFCRGRDLAAEGIVVVSLGGVTNIGKFMDVLGPDGLRLNVAGLCDSGEERYFLRAAERAGLGVQLSRADMEALGFWVCEADLEEELIRSLGVAVVESVIEAHGDLRALTIFRKQPAQLARTEQQRLRRFMGTISGRKINYGQWLVEALDPAEMPRPLSGLLDSI